MAESKNPFAKRDGKIITINDLSESEKDLSCNCVCPVCDGNFIARMQELSLCGTDLADMKNGNNRM